MGWLKIEHFQKVLSACSVYRSSMMTLVRMFFRLWESRMVSKLSESDVLQSCGSRNFLNDIAAFDYSPLR